MGVLADIFIASHGEALALEDTSGLPTSDVANYRRMTELEMGFIKQLLTGQELCYDAKLGFDAINVIDEGERITTRFPDDMLPLLAGMDDETMGNVAHGLADTEEMRCDTSDVMPVLVDLKRLAISAQERNLGLYLWNCV